MTEQNDNQPEEKQEQRQSPRVAAVGPVGGTSTGWTQRDSDAYLLLQEEERISPLSPYEVAVCVRNFSKHLQQLVNWPQTFVIDDWESVQRNESIDHVTILLPGLNGSVPDIGRMPHLDYPGRVTVKATSSGGSTFTVTTDRRDKWAASKYWWDRVWEDLEQQAGKKSERRTGGRKTHTQEQKTRVCEAWLAVQAHTTQAEFCRNYTEIEITDRTLQRYLRELHY